MADNGPSFTGQWEKRGIFDEPRLSEIVALYRELGFEVRCDSLDLLQISGCSDCMKQSPGNYRVVYTRK